MPRLVPTPSLTRTLHPARLLHSTALRSFASTDADAKGAQNSRPGWSGRSGDPNSKHGDDHAVERDGLDAQSKESQQGLKKRQDAEMGATDSSHGQGVSRKDEKDSNKKAKEEHPEAPEPVIGMNSERGSRGH